MTELLSSPGVNVSQERVRKSLCRVSPMYQNLRTRRAERLTNPMPIILVKLHIDQNEKLVMFGVTCVCH